MNLSCRDTFALTPGTTIPWVWKLVTSSFMESSPLILIVHVCACLVVAAAVEDHYGTGEVVKLMSCCAIASGAVCFLAQYLLFFLVRSAGAALFTPRYTFAGIMGGLVVAVTRCLPAGAKMLPPDKLPAAYVGTFATAVLLTGALGLLPMAVSGTAAGWAYVRYLSSAPTQGEPRCALARERGRKRF